jgi:aminoglycoside phosphotransferase (APT) family kinase protein
MQRDELAGLLQAFCRAHLGDVGALVDEVCVLDGHAGFSYGFRACCQRRGEQIQERFVLRLPPPNVRLVGPADVLRQAQVLRALAGSAVPVARVRWASDERRWFGRPYTIVERRPGETLRLIGDGALPSVLSPDALYSMAGQAVQALADLHELDWLALLPEWSPPATLEDEVWHWDFLIERAAETRLIGSAPALRDRLLESLPETRRAGIVHGDFQWTNLLFDGGALRAVLDWELAGIGSVLRDLGWLMVFSDRESWSDEVRWQIPLPPPAWLAERYAQASGQQVRDIAWYRALAGYSFGLIAAFNLRLHRRGRRIDPFYETLAPSIPRLFARANAVLDGAE